MDYLNFIKKVWDSVYDPKVDIEETISRYFHDDYEQCVNGVILNRQEYLDHVIEQRKNVVIEAIDYKHAIQAENEFFCLYYPKGRNSEGGLIEAEVIAYFRFQDYKIINIHGQVRLIAGNVCDVDM